MLRYHFIVVAQFAKSFRSHLGVFLLCRLMCLLKWMLLIFAIWEVP